jgi:ribose-phosphate pyrophosphokinase
MMPGIFSMELMKKVSSYEREDMNTIITTLQDHERALNLAQCLSLSFKRSRFTIFADGEVEAIFEENIHGAGAQIIIVQTITKPVNELMVGIMGLALQVKKKGAEKVILVAPYCAYARHDGFLQTMLPACGIDELVTVMVHDGIMSNAGSLTIHDVNVHQTIANHIASSFNDVKTMCLVAPDEGAADHVARIAALLGIVDTMVFKKERYDRNKTRIVGISGSSSAAHAIIIDDIIDTGGTAIAVAQQLHHAGMKVTGYFVHPVLSGNAIERIEQSPFECIYVSDTLPITRAHASKIHQFSVTHDLVTAVQKIIHQDDVSPVYQMTPDILVMK